jgi:formate dehydrogenase subunit gamma
MRRHEKSTVVDRYTSGARINHWITAITLILLALSGFALFHPSLFFLTALFGGGQWTRILHPFMGIVLVVSFAGLFLRFVWYNFPNVDDIRWLARIRDVIGGNEEKLPEIGRYNAGQKFVFWAMTFLITLLVLSGLGLWDTYFGQYLTIEQKRWAAVLHAGGAVAIVLVWILHVYAAIWVKGTVRAMTRGSVTGGWAWRHHRKWLRREVDGGKHVHGGPVRAAGKQPIGDRAAAE